VIDTREVLAVHHIPAGPPLSARIAGALRRSALLLGRARCHRSSRLALGAMVSTVVTALVLAVPMVAGTGAVSPVVLGQDGRPVSSQVFAGMTSSATFSSETGEATAAPSTTQAPGAGSPTSDPSDTGSAPAGTVAAAPDPTTSAPAAPPEAEADATPSSEAETAEVEAPATPATSAAAPATGGTEEQVLALVNAERAAAGCEAVVADAELASVARAHSEDMRDRGFFDHVNLDGLDPFDRADQAGTEARAENIARGQQDAAAVMDAWMNSAGHRANILNCGLTRLGVGIAEGGGGPWWTQLFG
jgi:uncharacterized protein YkwD